MVRFNIPLTKQYLDHYRICGCSGRNWNNNDNVLHPPTFISGGYHKLFLLSHFVSSCGTLALGGTWMDATSKDYN